MMLPESLQSLRQSVRLLLVHLLDHPLWEILEVLNREELEEIANALDAGPPIPVIDTLAD